MKVFQIPEVKKITYSARDILTASSETDPTQPKTDTKTGSNGEIIMPPDEFDD